MEEKPVRPRPSPCERSALRETISPRTHAGAGPKAPSALALLPFVGSGARFVPSPSARLVMKREEIDRQWYRQDRDGPHFRKRQRRENGRQSLSRPVSSANEAANGTRIMADVEQMPTSTVATIRIGS